MTVSALNEYISGKMKGDSTLSDLLISGEISGFKHHSSGHMYFLLKDENSQINCVMFRGQASKLQFEPLNGMKVLIQGSVQVFVKGGSYQLYASDIQPDGIGAAYLAVEQLKERLYREGLFDPAHKKRTPVMPSKIGVVTAKGGAALQDIINIISRRCPMTELVVFDCLVQGNTAAASIVERLIQADNYGVDVIICGRGGGSPEDLMCFNDERIARTVYAMKTPVISAVGHQIDNTVIDLVADLRAPTPSAAAEMAVPSIDQLQKDVNDRINAVNNLMKTIFMRKRQQLEDRAKNLRALYPAYRFSVMEKAIASHRDSLCKTMEHFITVRAEHRDSMETAIGQRMDGIIKRDAARLSQNAAALDALSPLKTLQRGYSIVYKDESIVRSSREIAEGDVLSINFAEGAAKAEVKEIIS